MSAAAFLTDGGIETTLLHDDGLDLPYFAAFPLLVRRAGRDALRRYFDSYAALAASFGTGVVLETPTWRASREWARLVGYDDGALARANREAVALVEEVRPRHETDACPVVISGCIGPRSDGYTPLEMMTAGEAADYHAAQIATFADTRADLVTAMTMTYPAEAVGITRAAREAGMPVVISFTVETDGSLPTGESLPESIALVDEASGGYPAYYMVNCAHPTHFAHVLDRGDVPAGRLRGVRANASVLSRDELDEAPELDRGDPADLAARYGELRRRHPSLTVFGGCCGTDTAHLGAIADAVGAQPRPVGMSTAGH
ncbi:MAG: homocysteine S-methyltransferase family protein [Actinomycetota bacterium]|nr:homocysteine S-methyltransferase family protein [Actinomycetota bacterium]